MLDGGGDVAVVNRADLLGGVPLAGDRMFGQLLKMAVPVAVNERKAEHGPVEPAILQRLLRCDLAGRISRSRTDRIVLASWVRAVYAVDVAGALEDEAGLRCMSLHGRDEVTRPLQIALPDQVGVLAAKNCGKMDDVRD